MKLWIVGDSDGYAAGVFTTLEKAKAEAERWNEDGSDAKWETYPSPDRLTYRIYADDGDEDYFIDLRQVEVDVPVVGDVR